MRTILSLLSIVLFFISIPSTEGKQNLDVDPDYGVLWIALRLIDQDALGGPSPIVDDWIETCDGFPPRLLSDGMPHGVRQNHSSQPARELPHERCEGVVTLKLSGMIGGEFVVGKNVLWQPGLNGSRWIGIPKDGTRRVRIAIPDLVDAGSHYYRLPEPIVIRPSGHEQLMVIEVPLRRLTELYISCASCTVEDRERIADRYTYWTNDSRAVLEPGMRILHAPKRRRLDVTLIDPRGRIHAITPPMQPEIFVELSANYGWRYVVEVVPWRDQGDLIARAQTEP